MIYIILLILAILLNAIMDADSLDAFDRLFKKRYEKNPTKLNWILYEWVQGETWQNKYDMLTWMVNKGLPYKLANWLAKDVFVVFSDLWHFAKAIMMVCFEIPIAVLLSPMVPFIPLWLLLLSIFLIGGVIFNLFYYNLRKIK